MEAEAWQSVSVIEDTKGVPHVRQQEVMVYSSGTNEGGPGYTKPLMKHRIVPVNDLVEL